MRTIEHINKRNPINVTTLNDPLLPKFTAFPVVLGPDKGLIVINIPAPNNARIPNVATTLLFLKNVCFFVIIYLVIKGLYVL